MTRAGRTVPKLVAIDLDGTVLNSHGRISGRTQAAIARARCAGARVVIVTFRAYRSSMPFALELGLHVPLICVNGALVKDASDGRILEVFPVPTAAAREVVEYGMAHVDGALLWRRSLRRGSARPRAPRLGGGR